MCHSTEPCADYTFVALDLLIPVVFLLLPAGGMGYMLGRSPSGRIALPKLLGTFAAIPLAFGTFALLVGLSAHRPPQISLAIFPALAVVFPAVGGVSFWLGARRGPG